MTKKSSTKNTKTTSKKKTTQKHDLIYVMSNSCGWCKKAAPIVEQLRDKGYDITQLDVAVPDENSRANEIKQKYNAQCGTPFFIDAETGNQVCGFRELDVLEKWAKGEEIPKPPQPKSPPPAPPADLETASEDEINKWKGEYETWSVENKHLPKILPFNEVVERVKQAQQMRKQQQAGGTPGAPGAPGGAPTPGGGNVQHALKFNTDFYYVVIDGINNLVKADAPYIQSLKHQYFQREQDGRLTKVVGDTTFVTPQSAAVPSPGYQGTKAVPPGRPAQPAELQKKSQEVLEKTKQAAKNAKAKTTAKSKGNKKTIESF